MKFSKLSKRRIEEALTLLEAVMDKLTGHECAHFGVYDVQNKMEEAVDRPRVVAKGAKP